MFYTSPIIIFSLQSLNDVKYTVFSIYLIRNHEHIANITYSPSIIYSLGPETKLGIPTLPKISETQPYELNLALPSKKMPIVGRVNGQTSDRAEIQTTNFQMQYLGICSDSTHITPRSAITHFQGSCEWFKHDCRVLRVSLEQILQLKAGCPNFSSV